MIFPLGDENPTRTTPVMTWLLIAANAAVFFAFNLQMGAREVDSWTLQWGFDVGHPFSRQILTSMFMHGGWAHILGNMWVLWIVGNNVEDKVGKLRYLLLYVAGGVAASLTYTLIQQRMPVPEYPVEILRRIPELEGRYPPLVGASGAIAAVMGMYLVFFPEARIRILVWFYVVPVRAKWFIGLTILLDLFRSVQTQQAAVGGVATMAHVGGGVFGVLAALVLKPMIGGGGEGDPWDVHTGFSTRVRAGSEDWHPHARGAADRLAPAETDESSLAEAERAISRLVREGRVREAIDVYPSYVALAREQPLPDDVQIEIAHEFYRQWLPRDAIPAYLRYLETHPRGDDVAEAKFRLGVLFARGMGRPDEAARWLSEAQLEHPDPKIRESARQMLAQLGG
jgi:membrane associated rhomboid family serine protease